MRRVSPSCAGAARSDLPTPSPPPAAYKTFTNTPPEQGGLRSHQAVITESDVTVYRLYDGRAPEKSGVARREGVYWADFTVASEPHARDQLAVCKGWNDMARLVTCTLPKGYTIIRGPGQDVNCAVSPGSGSTAYHPGGAPQLFISKPSILQNCRDTNTGW